MVGVELTFSKRGQHSDKSPYCYSTVMFLVSSLSTSNVADGISLLSVLSVDAELEL